MSKRNLIVKFYDDPNTNDEDILLKEKDASIIYSGSYADTYALARDFIGYWKKISYNLSGLSEEGSNLNQKLNNLISQGIKKDTNVLKDYRPGFSINIVEDKFRAVKAYKSVLEDNVNIPFSLVNLKCSYGGENFYAPKSVLLFLDLIIRSLTKNNLEIFNDEVKKNYYKNLEDYIGYPF